jgi:NAD(P)H dehydrogenase (quinone)
MRRILFVHAHPEQKSFNSSLSNAAADYFRSNGAEVRISDLYSMGFNPVGGKHDFLSLSNPDFFKYQLEQVNAFEKNLFAADVKSEMEKLLWCDTLIFTFPLWWFGLPAILKGWVDRVFAMGFCYGAGKGVYDNGTFKDKTGFCIITTGGPEVAYGKTGKNGELDQILYPIHHGMFYFIGMQVKAPFICFSPARISDDERKLELKKLETYLDSVSSKENLY